MCIANRIGPPVEGDNFYGREKELRSANRLLDSGHSLLLSAPRRIGKSSLAKRVIDDKQRQGWKCVYIDLEQTTTEEGFLRLVIEHFSQNQIWKQIAEGMSQGIKALLDRVQKVSIGSIGIELAKREHQEDLYKILYEALRHDEDCFIVVDELTLFLGSLLKSENGEKKVSFILNWLRSLRQVRGTKVRWLFCGSVGLKNFTSSFDMSADMVEYALEKLFWSIPYFIQILFAKLSDNYNGNSVTKTDVDQAYNELCSESYLNTWSERLVEYRELESPARQILKALSSDKAGIDRDGLLNILMTGRDAAKAEETDHLLSHVLEMLENDGYLLRKGSVRTFRSPLLRDYWYGKFVQ